MTAVSSELLHATSVAIGDRAILIESREPYDRANLALQMIDRGARLISDRETMCSRRERELLACAVAGAVAGQVHAHGTGPLFVPHSDHVPVALLLILAEDVSQHPDGVESRVIAGVEIPVIALSTRDVAAPIKATLWLDQQLSRKQ